MATVASPDLTGLTANLITDQFYQREDFMRAMKVFVVAFSHYRTVNRVMYQQKYNEFLQAMIKLYAIQPAPQHNIQHEIETGDLTKEKVRLRIGVKKCEFVNGVDIPAGGLRARATFGGTAADTIQLVTNRQIQSNVQWSRLMTYDEFNQIRRQNQVISLELGAKQWPAHRINQPLHTFTISVREIHAEGFEEWFVCGRGVRLLIRAEYEMVEPYDQQTNTLNSSYFQTHSLLRVLTASVEQYRAVHNHRRGTGHRVYAHKYSVTYITERVDPNTSNAYWRSGLSDLQVRTIGLQAAALHAATDLSDDPRPAGAFFRPNIKYCDLQIGYEFEDEFPDSVCVCSQWCNWNAFFHHNPMFRFLLVAHNRLYMTNRASIPEIYVWVGIHVASIASQQALATNQPVPITPVLQLVHNAKTYMKLFYDLYVMKSPAHLATYADSKPYPPTLNGLSYLNLRHSLNAVQLCHQLNANPFDDLCIDTLNAYYDVFDHLHRWISTIPLYVDQNDELEWVLEYESVSRKHYRRYIIISYTKKILDLEASHDYLFSEDYESARHEPQDRDRQEVQEKRLKDSLRRKGFDDNRHNVRVLCSPVADIWLSIHKFISKIDPMLPVPESPEPLEDMFESYLKLDSFFMDCIDRATAGPQDDPQFFLQFHILESELQQRRLTELIEHLHAVYTLKLYAISADIQNYCLDIGNKYLSYNTADFRRVYNDFNFIYEYENLELTFCRQYPNQWLFGIDPRVTDSIANFYDAFWTRAEHETEHLARQAAGQPQLDLIDNIEYGYRQYNRLYFWWRHNGNDRPKFRAILRSFTQNLDHIVERSEQILHSFIFPLAMDMKTRFETEFGVIWTEQTFGQKSRYVETMDELVLYLVKADCYMIVSLCATYLRKLYSLVIQSLYGYQYLLSKPGWVPLLRVLTDVKLALNGLKTQYVDYNDRLERIETTVDRTEKRIRDMFRDFYRKLLTEWGEEIEMIYQSPVSGGVPTTCATFFLCLHLSVGLSFLAAFVDDFRSEAQCNRKVILSMLAQPPPQPPLPHQQAFHACAPICRRFLRSPVDIETAQPFRSDIWRLQPSGATLRVFIKLDEQTGQQLGVDLQEADNWD